jgi:two-component system, response regulator PdtaR
MIQPDTCTMSDPDRNRLLLVEDDRLISATLAAGLHASGYDVATASSAEAAQRLLEAQCFDLAILDEQLPGMTGLELAEQMRETYALPVIFLTAFGDAGRVRGAIERGALAYLVKPVDLAQLLPTLRAALARAEDIRTLRDTGHHLQRALDERREISIAIGMLMERMQIARQPAFEMLRKTARSQRRRIEDVAKEMLLHRNSDPLQSGAGK